jgi:hypothetical protein
LLALLVATGLAMHAAAADLGSAPNAASVSQFVAPGAAVECIEGGRQQQQEFARSTSMGYASKNSLRIRISGADKDVPSSAAFHDQRDVI